MASWGCRTELERENAGMGSWDAGMQQTGACGHAWEKACMEMKSSRPVGCYLMAKFQWPDLLG